MDRIADAPKWAVILGAVVLIGTLAFLVVWYGLGLGRPKPSEEERPEVYLDIPAGESKELRGSRLDTYNSNRYGSSSSVSSTDDYWNQLGESLAGTVADASPSGGAKDAGEDYLDPSVYTPDEIKAIRRGLTTKERVDAQKARMNSIGEPAPSQQGGTASPAASQRNSDSAYFARIERAYELAMKYQPGLTGGAALPPPGGAAPDPAADLVVPDEEERRIELEEPAVLPTDALADDGIISSLDAPSGAEAAGADGRPGVKPVKATFLKSEKLSSGQRVIIRLMQDLTLSNGTVIPANTHITGTCSFSKRLKIDVAMLHYGGRMFPTDLSVYDNDGTEGIYCPLAGESERKGKKAAQVAGEVVSSAGTIAGTLLTGNPFMGRMATTGIQAATSSIASDGTVSVNVSAGYEFYVYENIKDDKNGKNR